MKEDRKERPPWLSKELRRLIRRKANLWRRYTTSGKMGSLENYKKCAKEVKKGVKEAENLVSKSLMEGNTVDVLYTDFSKELTV